MTLSASTPSEVESTTRDLARASAERAPDQGAIPVVVQRQPAHLDAPTLPAAAWSGGSRTEPPFGRPAPPVECRSAFDGSTSELAVTKLSAQPPRHMPPIGAELAITRPSSTATTVLADLAVTKLSFEPPRLWRDRGAEHRNRVVVLSDQGASSLPRTFTPYLATNVRRGPGGYALLDLPGLGPVFAQAAPVPPGWRRHVNEDPLHLSLLGYGKPPWICWSDLSHAQQRLIAETLTDQQRIAYRPERTKAKNLRTRMAQFDLGCLAWLMIDDEGRTVPVPLEEDLYPTPEAAMEAARQRWAYPAGQEGPKRRGFARARPGGQDRT